MPHTTVARALLALPADQSIPQVLRAGAASERAEWGDPVSAGTYPRSTAAHTAAADLLDRLAVTTEASCRNLSGVMGQDEVARWALRYLPGVAEGVLFAIAVQAANQA